MWQVACNAMMMPHIISLAHLVHRPLPTIRKCQLALFIRNKPCEWHCLNSVILRYISLQNIQIVFYNVFVDWNMKVQEHADTCSRMSLMVSELEYCIYGCKSYYSVSHNFVSPFTAAVNPLHAFIQSKPAK
jgi:hypothetical protein